MPDDALTFLLGFAAVFGALGWYLWRLEREVRTLQRRLDDAGWPARVGRADGEKAPGDGQAMGTGPGEAGRIAPRSSPAGAPAPAPSPGSRDATTVKEPGKETGP